MMSVYILCLLLCCMLMHIYKVLIYEYVYVYVTIELARYHILLYTICMNALLVDLSSNRILVVHNLVYSYPFLTYTSPLRMHIPPPPTYVTLLQVPARRPVHRHSPVRDRRPQGRRRGRERAGLHICTI